MTHPHDLQRRADQAALERARDGILERLGVHFAYDDLTMPELEQRLEWAFRAKDAAALQEIVADLPVRGATAAQRSHVTHDVSVVPPRSVIGAFMGGHVRKGSWIVPRHLKIVAVMGGVELDLRQAVLGAGVTEIEVLAVMGGVDVIVPPGVRVETMGVAIMGGFDASAGDATATDPEQPVIRLSGFAVMAGVDARIKKPNAKAIRKFNKALLQARSRSDDTADDD
jgi:hypothetical protein